MFLLKDLIVVPQVAALETILSVDNAAAIGTMAADVKNEPLQPKGLNKLIPAKWRNNPKQAAVKVGVFGGILFRGLMLLGAVWLIHHRAAYFVGAAYLILLCWNNFVGTFWTEKLTFNPVEKSIEGGQKLWNVVTKKSGPVTGKGFWSAVISIELADLAFSLDNVVAVVGYSSKLWVVTTGVIIGMFTMRYAASIFIPLVEKVPALGHGAFAILGFLGIKMILTEVTDTHLPEFTQLGFSAGIMLMAWLTAVVNNKRKNSQPNGEPALAEAED